MRVVIHRLHFVLVRQRATPFRADRVQVLVATHRVVGDRFRFHRHLAIMHNRAPVLSNKYRFHLIMQAVLVPVRRRAA